MKVKRSMSLLMALFLLYQPFLVCVADLDEPQPQVVPMYSGEPNQQVDEKKVNINGPGGVKLEIDNPEIESIFAVYLPLFFIVGLFAALKYVTTWNSSQ